MSLLIYHIFLIKAFVSPSSVYRWLGLFNIWLVGNGLGSYLPWASFLEEFWKKGVQCLVATDIGTRLSATDTDALRQDCAITLISPEEPLDMNLIQFSKLLKPVLTLCLLWVSLKTAENKATGLEIKMRLVGGIADCKTHHILVMGVIIIVIYYLFALLRTQRRLGNDPCFLALKAFTVAPKLAWVI